MEQKIIIGLGNPGVDYINTRHNVGYKVIDELHKTKLPVNIIAKKTDTFMNDSGSFVKSQYSKYNIPNTNLYVVHDDLDMLLGSFKIQLGHGPKDHNGIKSIDEALGTDQYYHVKIGVDNRPLDNKPMGVEYVLQNFSDEENKILDKTIKEVAKKLILNLQSQISS